MSATQAPPRDVVVQEDTHVVDPQTAPDGSQDPDDAQADSVVGDEDTEVVETEETETQETAPEQETQRSETRGEPDAHAEMQRENAQLREIVDDVYQRMQRDPELARRLGANGGSGAQEAVSLYDQVETSLREGLKPEAADAVLKALGPLVKDYERMKHEYEGAVRPRLDNLSRVVGSTEYVRALTDNGISQEVQKSQQFQKFSRGLEQSLRGIRDQGLRAEFVANKWVAGQVRRNGYKDTRATIDTAKNGRGGSAPGRGASLAEKIVHIKRTPSDPSSHVAQAHSVRVQYAKAGKPIPRIEYDD